RLDVLLDERMESWRRRPLVNGVLGLPVLVVAAFAGYAWSRWLGVIVALLAIVGFQVVFRTSLWLRSRGSSPAASALPFALLGAAVGYVPLGGFGLVFVGVLTWLPMWFGLRTGRRMLQRDEAARAARLDAERRRSRQPSP